MSVLIKSMFVPESCNEWGNRICPFLDTEVYDCGFDEDSFDYVCLLTEHVIENTDLRPRWCPLVEVEEVKGYVGFGTPRKREITVLCVPNTKTVIEAED